MKNGWIRLHDGQLHYFDAPTEASHCGQQWIDETFKLYDHPLDKLPPTNTCKACLTRRQRELESAKPKG
jgi:hypothetical protein